MCALLEGCIGLPLATSQHVAADDEELAAVMAHEVSHVVARHQAERMTQTGVYQMLRVGAVQTPACLLVA